MVRMSIMPNHYRATYRDSISMTEFKTLTTDKKYSIIIGKIDDGSLRIQSILFPKTHFSSANATIIANIIENNWF